MSMKSDILKKILFSSFVMFLLMLTPVNTCISQAALNKRPASVQIETLMSNENFRNEYFKIRTPKDEKYVVYVSGKVQTNVKRLCIRIKKHYTNKIYITVFVKPNKNGEFSIKINTKQGNKNVPKILNKKGTVTKAKESISTCPGYSKVQKMTSGTYHLYITAATTKADANVSNGIKWKSGTLGGTEGKIYKEALFTIKKGQNNNLKLIKYDNVVSNNQNIRNLYERKSYHIDSYVGSYVRYRDVYMKDIPFVFKDPKTKEVEYMTDKQVKYIDGVAKEITKGCKSDYEKVLKIYEYVANNVYYDNYALAMHKNQYSNPYINLYNLRNDKKSANSKNGKVATTCQGYAALVVALSRAEGIPARFAYGRHIHQMGTIWDSVAKNDLNTVTHYWSEVYIDDEWMVVDARSAMRNQWKRISFTSKGTWVKKDFINYSHFDPTDEQLASSYIYVGIYPGAKDGKYINRIIEVDQLREFLNMQSAEGISNGKLLNPSYNSKDYSTWGTGEEENFKTNGYGRVSKIEWPNKNLSGDLTLNGFAKLKNLILNRNNLSSVQLLECNNLSFIDLKENELVKAQFMHKGDTISIKCTEGGTFSMEYDQESDELLTVYAQPEEGYVCAGIYNSDTGEHVTKKDIASFEPEEGSYLVVFIPKDMLGDDFDIFDKDQDDFDENTDVEIDDGTDDELADEIDDENGEVDIMDLE